MADIRNQGLRVRDSDRVDACALLDNARDTGELTAAEHAERTAAAMDARTFGDLDALVGDLQIPRNLVNSPLLRPQRRNDLRRWKIGAAALAVAMITGAMGGCISNSDPLRPQIPDATTGRGVASFIAAYQEHFGDSVVEEVTFYPEYVLVNRRGGNAQRDDRYRYDKGGFSSYGDTARSTGAEPVDLSKLDLPKLARLLAGAAETVHVPGGRAKYLSIEHKADKDPIVSVYAGKDDRSGYFTVTLSGEPLTVYPAKS
ncbi:DUF1707 SHOCT-like domain-containing protein [Nocardia inohanensis]|uniref:DUF1707 SHOCT-like domain-containing protein n=1 Tax=Nocardia inohanensis TaxID=209246 RepID=UPI00082BBB60|nr:DUF1707 domain-containing protein [Nocardia inohanensis]